MNAFFIKLAAIFTPITLIIRFVIFASIMALIYLFVGNDVTQQQAYLEPILLMLLWGVWLNLLVVSFQPETESATPKKGFFAGIKRTLSSLFTVIFSVLFLALSLATVYFTLKLISL